MGTGRTGGGVTAKRTQLSLAEQLEGAGTYLEQAAGRVAGLELGETPDQADLVAIEVARDEAREAAKLMQRVHERAARAAARAAQAGA